MANKITSVVFSEELYKVLKERARVNKRSLSGEVNHLIELGLSSGNEELVRILQIVTEIK